MRVITTTILNSVTADFEASGGIDQAEQAKLDDLKRHLDQQSAYRSLYDKHLKDARSLERGIVTATGFGLGMMAGIMNTDERGALALLTGGIPGILIGAIAGVIVYSVASGAHGLHLSVSDLAMRVHHGDPTENIRRATSYTQLFADLESGHGAGAPPHPEISTTP